MRLKYGVLFFLLALVLNLNGQSFKVNDELSTQNGLSQNSGYAILQDANGFVWIATQVDIMRFIRGQEARDYKKVAYSELGWAPICETAVIKDFGDSWLWVGTCNGLGKISTKDYKPKRVLGTKGFDIRAIAKIGRDSLLLGTSAGVHQAHINERDSLIIDSSLFGSAKIECRDIEVLNGYYWIGTDKGLFKYGRGLPQASFVKIAGADLDILDLLVDTDSTLMIAGKNKGVFRVPVNSSGGQLLPSYIPLEIKNVNVIFKDDEHFWLGTEGEGLVFTNHELNRIESSIKDLDANQIKALFRTEDGVYWIGTRGNGVKMICTKRQTFSQHYQPSGENLNPRHFIWSLLPDPIIDSHIYVGTDRGGLFLFDYINDRIVDALIPGNSRVNCVVIDSLNENLFAGTDNGLVSISLKKDKGLTYYSRELRVASILLKGERLFLGTKDNGLFLFDLKKKVSQPISMQLPADRPSSVWFLGQGINGQVLVGFDQGIRVIDNPYATNPVARRNNLFGELEGKESVNCIYQPPDSQVYWIGTRGNGLYRISPSGEGGRGKISNFNIHNGLLDNVIYGILPDRDGNLWISTNRGISKLTTSKKDFIHYYVNDGLQFSEFNTGAYGAKGDSLLFFGGLRGFNSFIPQLDTNIHYSFSAVLTYFQIDDDKVRPIEKYLRPNKTDTITVDFNYDHIEYALYSSDFQNIKSYNYHYSLYRLNERLLDSTLYGEPAFFLPNEKKGLEKGIWRYREYRLSLQVADVSGAYSQDYQLVIILQPEEILGIPKGWWFLSGSLILLFLFSLLIEYISVHNRFDLLRKVGKKLAMANSEAQIQKVLEEDLVKTGKLRSVLKSDLMGIFSYYRLDETLQLIAGYEQDYKWKSNIFFDPNDPQERRERPAVWCWLEEWTHRWEDEKGNLVKGEIFTNNTPALLRERAGKIPQAKEGRNAESMIYQLLELERNDEEGDARKKIGLITLQSFKKGAYRHGIYSRIKSLIRSPQRTVISELLEDLGNSIASALIRVEKIRESDLVEAHLRQYRSIMDVHSIPKFVKQIEVLVDEKDVRLEKRFNAEISELLRALPGDQPSSVFDKARSIIQITVEEKKRVEFFINKIVSFVRTLIHEGEAYITVENEINLLRDYEEIINIVHAGKVTIQTDFDSISHDFYNLSMPSMLIQPLIENSIKHGRYYTHNDNNINILVRFSIKEWKTENYLFLSVIDDGIGINRRKEIKRNEKLEYQGRAGLISAEAIEIFETAGKKFDSNTFKYLDKRIQKINEKYGHGKPEKMFYEIVDLSELNTVDPGLIERGYPGNRFKTGTLILIGIPLNFKFEGHA